ncbi:MAG TPA: FHA domain-containing protein [Verrucomicrobiae bacterium]|nr:FHA domain-containing protein [Verrucomicrobiae bacterium]
MPKLIIKCSELPVRSYELRVGVNRLGRSPRNDLQLDHPTVSGAHCEIVLSADGILVRDLGSTNGTYINQEQITERAIESGNTLHVGEVEMELDPVKANIAIPKLEPEPQQPRPQVLADGALSCPNHFEIRATFRCTHCKQLMCDECVHGLKRVGGKLLLLCPVCSNPCEPIAAPKRKRSFFGFLEKTLKMTSKLRSKR